MPKLASNPSRKVEAMYVYLSYELQLFTKGPTVCETIVEKPQGALMRSILSMRRHGWLNEYMYQTPLHTIDSVSYVHTTPFKTLKLLTILYV